MKIHPLGAELFDADGLTDGGNNRHMGRHEEDNSRFSQFCEENFCIIHVRRPQISKLNNQFRWALTSHCLWQYFSELIRPTSLKLATLLKFEIR